MKKPEHLLFDNKALMTLILPLIVEQLLATLVGMADSIMIASVGEAAVSGVSLVDSVMILLFNIFSALATGGAVVAGQYIGQQKIKEANEAAVQLLYFTTFIATVIMAICYLCKPFILNTVFGHIAPDVKAHANTYLMIVLLAVPFMSIYCGGAAIFRVMGNSKVSMKVSMIMNIINVSGNALLIYGFHRGTEGVAIPTLVSRIVASALMIWLLTDERYLLHLPKKLRYRPDGSLIKKILYIGVPNGMENSMFQLGKIIVLSLVSTFGTSAIAANAVANTVAGFHVLPGMAISLAVTTVVSQCIGAGDEQQAEYYAKKLLLITYVCIFVTVGVITLALPLILKLYNLTAETAAEATRILIFHGICACLIWPVAFTLPSVFRAAGDVKYAMTVSIASMWIFRILCSYIIAKYMKVGVFGVWVAMIIDWIARAIAFGYRFVSGRWKGHAVV